MERRVTPNSPALGGIDHRVRKFLCPPLVTASHGLQFTRQGIIQKSVARSVPASASAKLTPWPWSEVVSHVMACGPPITQ